MSGVNLRALSRSFCSTRSICEPFIWTKPYRPGRTGHSPINLATLRNAVINAIHAAGYLHVPEGRRDHTRPTEALHLHGLP